MTNDNKVERMPNNIPPFVKFCCANVPAVFDDSLSYYEALCALWKYLQDCIDVINNNALLEEEYIEKFNVLKAYVEHYFENLDVQEEINNKLDAMATSGELEEYFARYVTPQLTALDEKVETYNTNTNDRIDGIIESGVAPLTASSTSEMLLTDKVYVNTTDGNWYYWNGSNWTQGGTYQSTAIGSKSVHFQSLDDELQSSVEPVNDITNITTFNSGFCNPNGTIAAPTSTTLAYYEFSVSASDTYKVHIMLDASYSTDKVAIQFLHDSTVVANTLKSGVTVTNNYYTTTFTIPSNVNKVRLNTNQNPAKTSYGNCILKVGKYQVDNISKDQLDSTLQSFFINQYEEVTPTQFVPNAFLRTTDFAAYTTTEVLSLAVNPHEVYRITGTQVDNNPIVAFCTNNKTTTLTLNGNDYQINNYYEYIKSDTNRYEYDDYVFTIPEYCNKIYINHFTSDTTLKIEKCTGYVINGTSVIEDYDKIGIDKIIAIGDSITEKNYRAAYNYLDYIKQDMPTVTIQNLGASGTGYKNPAGGVNTFAYRINSISSYDADSEVVIVMGSVNDIQYVASSLGQLGDTTDDTVYGAIYKFFHDLFEEFNGVRVGCISPINWKNSNTNASVPLYLKALKDTCELFNVPYFDLYSQTNLRPNDSAFLNAYYMSDGAGHEPTLDSAGIHPNSDGHRLIYHRIKEFIKTL